MMWNSAIYEGEVVHARHRPKQHRLRYSVFALLLDLDELETLHGALKLFGYNRAAVFSFHDRDHGPGDGTPLKSWVMAELQNAGISPAELRVEILCYPRIFGYVFNPLTVYYCCYPNGDAAAVLYEVTNTFHERHTYVIPADGSQKTLYQSAEKRMYVSPFMPMECTYDFRIDLPGERIAVKINESDADGPMLFASFTGKRKGLSDASLGKVLIAYPLMTAKVMIGIHFEAARLWAKGLKVFRHAPADDRISSSVVAAKEGK